MTYIRSMNWTYSPYQEVLSLVISPSQDILYIHSGGVSKPEYLGGVFPPDDFFSMFIILANCSAVQGVYLPDHHFGSGYTYREIPPALTPGHLSLP